MAAADAAARLIEANSILVDLLQDSPLDEDEFATRIAQRTPEGESPLEASVARLLVQILVQNQSLVALRDRKKPVAPVGDDFGGPQMRAMFALQDQQEILEDWPADRHTDLVAFLEARPSPHFWAPQATPYDPTAAPKEPAKEPEATALADSSTYDDDDFEEEEESTPPTPAAAKASSAPEAAGGKSDDDADDGGADESAMDRTFDVATSDSRPQPQNQEEDKQQQSAQQERVLVHRHGEFHLVDASDVQAAEMAGLPTAIVDDNPAQSTQRVSFNETKRQPRPPAERARSAAPRPKTSRARSARMRPKSAVETPPRAHSASLRSGLFQFSSEEGKDSFEAWLRRKAEQQRQDRNARANAGISESEEERRARAEQSYQAWLRRKEEMRKQSKHDDNEQDSMRRTRHKPEESDALFHQWLDKKRMESRRDAEEARIRKSLLEEQARIQDERKRASEAAVNDWHQRKREEERRQREHDKVRRRRQAAEMRRIKQNLESIYMPKEDDEPIWRGADSSGLRRKARARQANTVLSESLHRLQFS
eukprot:m.107695 g.107695  ORF g.107695 m.107695 type:complete len:539 (-) comp9228_c0_seq2:322-1938(-)